MLRIVRASGVRMVTSHISPAAARHMMRSVSVSATGCLFVVGLPLGNVADLSPRALTTICAANLVAAEDTRVTKALLRRAGHSGEISRIVSCHEHNHEERLALVMSTLQSGGNVALVSDAGTPGISDPGAPIVTAAAAAGFRVSPIPGPCAASAAVSVSGAVSPLGFLVAGFLPRSGPQRTRQIAFIASERVRPTVLYEAPHRIERTLADLTAACEAAGTASRSRSENAKPRCRRITICREMTKEHEQIITFPSISAAAASLVAADIAREGSSGPRSKAESQVAPLLNAATVPIPALGEFTLVIHADEEELVRATESGKSAVQRPATTDAAEGAGSEDGGDNADTSAQPSLAEALELLQDLRARMPGLKPSDAVARVAAMTGVRRKLLYSEVLAREAISADQVSPQAGKASRRSSKPPTQ